MPRLTPDPSPERARRPRVLLVDDDERNLLALSEVLGPIADVVSATSGRMALRELLRDEFAVILLDVFMPDMDGYETASLIRKRSQTARIPIIFLSAVNKETEHLMRGYAMGAVDYVFKPVDPVVLKSKVAVFVDLFELRQQVAEQTRAEQELREAKLRAETDRLAVERELQHARLRQAALLEALPLALYEAKFDDTGRLTRQFLGGDVAKVAGVDVEALASGELRWCDRIDEAQLAELERRLASGEETTVTAQYRWTRSDGTTIHVLDQCVGSAETQGHWVGTLIDITVQRELEQQLIQSRKAEALGQLTGGVAHDFNNLLAAVLGGLRLLESRVAFGEAEQRIVDHMRLAGEKGAELVRRLMAFARKQDLSPSSVDPAKLCDTVAGLVEHALDGVVTIDWQMPAGDLQIYADQAQLELALVNLLINARDAMPEGGTITVGIEPAAPPANADGSGEYLQVRIRDDGSGIPAELLERVTEPFFTTKTNGKGTGLGLSMVAGFVEQSGGEFRIASEVGHGTQIDLVLPASRAEAAAKEAEVAPDAPIPLVGSVLLVDDDPGVRLILSEHLRDLGLEVAVAEDGPQALDVLEQSAGELDFVLTDYSMPGMDGVRLLLAIGERWPTIRGAIMTGNPQENVAREAAQVPMIHKPVDMAELKRLLAAN
ncbi:MAG TPA: response regulator [Croceibacterium sp.]